MRSLASFCYRRRWLVLVLWIATLVGIQSAARAAGDAYSFELNLEQAESWDAMMLVRDRFPAFSGLDGEIVYANDTPLAEDAEAAASLQALFDDVAALEVVDSVRMPGTAMEAVPIAIGPEGLDPDGGIGFVSVQFGDNWVELTPEDLEPIRELVAGFEAEGLQVELGGDMFADQEPPASSELLGLIAAVFILLVAFGSVVAMGLPIGTAIFGLMVGFGIVGLTAHVTTVPDFATQLAAMIGIGVGIDYALFIVTRYRQGLANGLEPEAAVAAAVDTAGRAVIFAGITVVISLSGMLLIGIDFVGGLGIAAAAVVLVTMCTSVTLLPALLGFAGRNIDRLSLPGARKRAEGSRHTFWFRWSRALQGHPWPAAIAGFVVLAALAIPVTSMRFGFTDAGNRSTADTTRRAYDLKIEALGEGSSAALLMVASVPAGTDASALAPLVDALEADPGIAAVLGDPQLNDDGDVALITAFPTTNGQDPETVATIERLREEVIPGVESGGVDIMVGGYTALTEDMSVQLKERLPVFIGVVLGLSFLLLLVVFRSVLVPIKAVIMNLLSIGSAYGLIVAIFQWGWGAELLGIGKEGPIEAFLPMMMFAILFGLSMDYEVFLLSRIKEEYDLTGDNSLAVADGLSATARVITAAALIMVTVFGSFVISDERVIKMFGVGLASAIFIDATIVRMVLVPATMELLGKTNWWFPRWLAWLPIVHVEGSVEEIEATTLPEGPYGYEPDEQDELSSISGNP